MEQLFMKAAELIGAPALLILIGIIIWILVKILMSMNSMSLIIIEIQTDLKEVKEGKMWKEACNERHDAIGITLKNHETRLHEIEIKRA
jgi:hypothetical protein